MKNKKKKQTGIPRFLAVTAAALMLPFLGRELYRNAAAISGFGARAAVISAAAAMPDAGIAMLRERFRAALYDGEEQAPAAPAPSPEAEQQPAEANPDPFEPPGEAEPEPAQPQTTPAAPPKIPEKYAAALLSENYSGKDNGSLVKFGDGFIKNDTDRTDSKIEEILETPFGLEFTNTSEPQVLIFHTHATESFERFDTMVYDTRNTWRSTDNNSNMVAVGAAMQQSLEQNGIGVIHDTTQHDYPSYNGSYERSAETVKAYLEQYPSIKVVLDLHRDAMERDNQAIVKPVAMIDGQKTAQLMMICCCDDGSMNIPDWRKNLRFAAAFQDQAERMYPGLTRPILLCHRKYNMDLSPGSLLLEFGSNANTIEEAIRSAELAGLALAELITQNAAG